MFNYYIKFKKYTVSTNKINSRFFIVKIKEKLMSLCII